MAVSDLSNRVSHQPAVLIKPDSPSKPQVIALSPIDNVLPVISFHFQFVYENANNDPNFMHPDAMKSSLAKLLVEYPLMAGRASVEDKKWYIDCNDAGVSFVVAHSDLALKDFDFGDYDQYPKGLCTQWTNPSDPVWQVQLTYFRCGGVILVSEMFHQLGDGETNSALMKKWANIHANQPYSPPVLDRTLIRASGNPIPSTMPLWKADGYEPDFATLYPKLLLSTAKRIEFSAKELEAMKLDAQNLIDKDVPWISTNDALCSHMWRLITRARGLPPSTETAMLHSCNVRKKITPPLTSDYVGNVLAYAHTDSMTAQELGSSPLSRIAAFSRRAINNITPAYVRSFVDWISVNHTAKPVTNVIFGTDVFATSWTSFDLYSVVFENCEKPCFVGEIPTIMDGVFKLVEGRAKGSISIQTSMLREHMDKLLTDPELHKYAPTSNS
ncbi:transferase [Basidiobolus meristosporus CBS 931.73]|uniref:Transferase n=1 Tax=Basidiobolus meristosporus CBS 931.73 TaxID=1314790 RepID=A0A1Y1Y4B8_9FUNG|nr:transferase [Basidiobolus meristosporus CBS 931.73]|eukprot:ORX92424.1 transferase [Basidiobolus meristosporus CBS 931.73]